MPPPRLTPPGFTRIRLNRSFDTFEEMEKQAGGKIVKWWKVEYFHCEVLVPDTKKEKRKK